VGLYLISRKYLIVGDGDHGAFGGLSGIFRRKERDGSVRSHAACSVSVVYALKISPWLRAGCLFHSGIFTLNALTGRLRFDKSAGGDPEAVADRHDFYGRLPILGDIRDYSSLALRPSSATALPLSGGTGSIEKLC